MEAHVMQLENNYVIVDKEYFNEIKKKAESNQERINEIAEEKVFKYVRDSGIKLSYEGNGIPYIFHHDLLSELNYEERGYPESVSERVKHTIADDIAEALNDKLKGLKDEVLNYALSEFDKQKHGLEATVKIWKHFALIFIITTIILTIRLFIQL
jgi:Mn-dependent DtxR family transcriptional regulator